MNNIKYNQMSINQKINTKSFLIGNDPVFGCRTRFVFNYGAPFSSNVYMQPVLLTVPFCNATKNQMSELHKR